MQAVIRLNLHVSAVCALRLRRPLGKEAAAAQLDGVCYDIIVIHLGERGTEGGERGEAISRRRKEGREGI